MIEGLSALTGPQRGVLASHKFSLPPGFPADKSGKWEEDGPSIIEAEQPEILYSANCKADGWRVYKVLDKVATEARNEKLVAEHATSGSKEKLKFPPPVMVTYKRVVGKKTFVLMMRPKALQLAVNKIYADTSRALVNQEVNGETARANEAGDPGVITNADLRRFDRGQAEDEGANYLPVGGGGQPTRVDEASTLQIQ